MTARVHVVCHFGSHSLGSSHHVLFHTHPLATPPPLVFLPPTIPPSLVPLGFPTVPTGPLHAEPPDAPVHDGSPQPYPRRRQPRAHAALVAPVAQLGGDSAALCRVASRGAAEGKGGRGTGERWGARKRRYRVCTHLHTGDWRGGEGRDRRGLLPRVTGLVAGGLCIGYRANSEIAQPKEHSMRGRIVKRSRCFFVGLLSEDRRDSGPRDPHLTVPFRAMS